MKTRLEQLCEAFGWQGGTIHQAQDALRSLYRLKQKPDVLNMPEAEFQALKDGIEFLRLCDGFLGASQ